MLLLALFVHDNSLFKNFKSSRRLTMTHKRYHIKSACPQCGCSFAQVLSEDELKKRYGDMPNIELECGECMLKFEADRKSACPEWDDECRLKEQQE
jgi:hypothetical protein